MSAMHFSKQYRMEHRKSRWGEALVLPKRSDWVEYGLDSRLGKFLELRRLLQDQINAVLP